MEFIVTNVCTEEEFSVTRECVYRVKGKQAIDLMIKDVKRTGEAVEIHFENDYDLMIKNK